MPAESSYVVRTTTHLLGNDVSGNVGRAQMAINSAVAITGPAASGTMPTLENAETFTGIKRFDANAHFTVVGGTGSGFWLDSITTGADRFFFGSDAAVADSFRVYSALASANIMQISSNATSTNAQTVFSGPINTGVVTVANLPPAGIGVGFRMFVTDSNQTHTAGIGTTVAGGGASKVPVYTDGTNWKIG